MRKSIALLASVAFALSTVAPAAGPKFSNSGGVGSADSTFSGGEPVGGTYAINGTTGTVSTPIVNLRPGAAPSSPQNGDCWTTVAGLFCRINGATVGPYQSSSGAGTVTQVGLVTPSIFTAGGAVTTSGNLSFSLNNQTANTVFAGPNGSTGAPAFRALVGADIPAVNLAGSGNGGVTGTLAVANGGTGSTTASAARTALGLGTMATQNAKTVAITGGSIAGITDLAVADGGTGASTAAAARTNLGATTVGGNLFTLANPGAVTFPRFNADNSVSALDAASTRTALGLGTAATVNTGTSGATIPLLNGTNTWSASQTFSNPITVGNSAFSSNDVELGGARGSDGAAYVDLHATTGTDYDARVIRNSGANGTFEISQTGTGNLSLRTGATAGALADRLTINSGGSITVPGTINGGRVAPECANILAYGGDASGSNDNVAAFNAAVAANQSDEICVYLPAGDYKFNSTPTVTLPSGTSVASVTIRGDGSDVTKLRPAANVNGLAINLTADQHSYHIQNLSVLAGNQSATSKGIVVTQTGTFPLPNPTQNDITGVTVRGADGYNVSYRFNTGIELTSVSNNNLVGVVITGAAGGAYGSAGTGLKLQGSSSLIPVLYNLMGTQINHWQYGVSYGNYAQGLSISNGNFVGNGTAIYQPVGSVGNDQLTISASQFNSGTRNIYITGALDGFALSSSFVYLAAGAPASVELPGVQYAITGNTFIQFQGGGVGAGISINNYLLMAGSITGNTFENFSTAIVLQANSSNVVVAGNSYSNIVGSNIINNSTTSTSTIIKDDAEVALASATGLGTGGTLQLESGSRSSAGSIRMNAGSASTAANGTFTLSFDLAAPNRWVCTLTPSDIISTWARPVTLSSKFLNTTSVQVRWDNATTNLTASGGYFINYQCQPT